MEEARPYSPEHALRARNVPDVPEDVDFVMEHLNDPNFNLSRPPSFISVVDNKSTKKYDGEAESQIDYDRYSTSRAESRNSTAIDFDESVLLYRIHHFSSSNNVP